MVKKMLNLVSAVLALNFLVVAGGIGYLLFTGKLSKDRIGEIRALVLASDEPATTQPTTTQPAQEVPPTTPMLRMDTLLTEASGRVEPTQIGVVQTAFDAQNALLERRLREVEDQRRQLTQAKADFEAQRKSLLEQAAALAQKQEAQEKLAEDKGFQDTLTLYQAMPPKKVKDIFKGLPEDVVVRYLQSMEPRQAGSILKEFKTPEETSRAQAILEKMRQANAKAE